MKCNYIITFHTHYEALCCKRVIEQRISEVQIDKRTESDVKAKKMKGDEHLQISFKLIPVPRVLSSSCGTALSVEVSEKLKIDMNFLFECEHDEIYTLNEDGEYHKIS